MNYLFITPNIMYTHNTLLNLSIYTFAICMPSISRILYSLGFNFSLICKDKISFNKVSSLNLIFSLNIDTLFIFIKVILSYCISLHTLLYVQFDYCKYIHTLKVLCMVLFTYKCFRVDCDIFNF